MTDPDPESHLQKAFDCIEHPPSSGIYRSPGRPFGFHVANLIREDLPIDVETHRIAVSTMAKQLEPMIKEAAFEDNPEEVFFEQFEDYKTELLSSGFDEYEIVFPLNISDSDGLPESFTVRERVIQRLSKDTWESQYLTPAQFEADNLSRFFRRAPNDETDEEFTYWQVSCEARGHRYALHDVSLDIELLLGKLIYARYAGTLKPISHGLPQPQWSRLELPYFSMAFLDGEFQHFQIEDYESRYPESVNWKNNGFQERYETLPEFPGEITSGVEQDLVSVFREFQNGMTTRRTQESFFCFWRGIETLTQKERGEKTSIAVDRAVFAAELQYPPEDWDEQFDVSVADLQSIRNEVAHESGRGESNWHHQEVTKVLLDSLIHLYIKYKDEFDRQAFRYFLQHGAAGEESVKDLESDIESRVSAVEMLQDVFEEK